MPAQLTALSKGIDQLVTNYALLDTGINEYTGGVTQVALGYAKIVDGVSSLTKGSESCFPEVTLCMTAPESLPAALQPTATEYRR